MTNLNSMLKSRDITLPTKVHLVKAMVFPVVMYGCESWTVKKAEHWRIDVLNCGVGEDSWESLGLQGDPTSPFWRRSILGVHWKDWCWSWNSNTLATSCEELTHWKRLWRGEGLGARGEGDDRGWDGWMASQTRWTWVWLNSRGWWWTGWPGVLWFTGSQRVGHDWATELKWTECDKQHQQEDVPLLGERNRKQLPLPLQVTEWTVSQQKGVWQLKMAPRVLHVKRVEIFRDFHDHWLEVISTGHSFNRVSTN